MSSQKQVLTEVRVPTGRLAKVAFEYREKYGWGMDMPTLKLARIMYNENSLLFTTLDSARSALRGIEGKSAKNRRAVKNIPERPKNPYNLPKSEAEPFDPFEMPFYKRFL